MEQFKVRIKKRAAEKIQEAIREQEEEERKARLGPGGLDPVEVYEELPDVCMIKLLTVCCILINMSSVKYFSMKIHCTNQNQLLLKLDLARLCNDDDVPLSII